VARVHKNNFLKFANTTTNFLTLAISCKTVYFTPAQHQERTMPVEDMEPGVKPKWMQTTDGIVKKINSAQGDEELKRIIKKMKAHGMYVPPNLINE
jgi:hypothetical protein